VPVALTEPRLVLASGGDCVCLKGGASPAKAKASSASLVLVGRSLDEEPRESILVDRLGHVARSELRYALKQRGKMVSLDWGGMIWYNDQVTVEGFRDDYCNNRLFVLIYIE